MSELLDVWVRVPKRCSLLADPRNPDRRQRKVGTRTRALVSVRVRVPKVQGKVEPMRAVHREHILVESQMLVSAPVNVWVRVPKASVLQSERATGANLLNEEWGA
jgi:enterochelin esterase-like enzyme